LAWYAWQHGLVHRLGYTQRRKDRHSLSGQKMTKTLSCFLIVGLVAYPSLGDKPRPPSDRRHVVDHSVTTNLLHECGFKPSEEKPTTYVLAGVAVGDVLRQLGANLPDLQSVPCVAEGEDVRTLTFLNTHFVIEADRKVVDGKFVTERLDNPKAKCTVTVLFPHPGYKQEKKTQKLAGATGEPAAQP